MVSISILEPWFNIKVFEYADGLASWNVYKMEPAEKTTLQNIHDECKAGAY